MDASCATLASDGKQLVPSGLANSPRLSKQSFALDGRVLVSTAERQRAIKGLDSSLVITLARIQQRALQGHYVQGSAMAPHG